MMNTRPVDVQLEWIRKQGQSVDARLKEILYLRRQIINTRKQLAAQTKCLDKRKSMLLEDRLLRVGVTLYGKTLSAHFREGELKIRKRVIRRAE